MANTKALIGLLIASLGSGITTALAFQIPNSATFIILTITVAVLTPVATYLGVYGATNNPKVLPTKQTGIT
jgi:hypothetical protein